MQFVIMAAIMLGSVFAVYIFESDEPVEPVEPVQHVQLVQPAHLLTEEEIQRKHMLNACVLGAKFALRNNNPSGYARASAEMRKYA